MRQKATVIVAGLLVVSTGCKEPSGVAPAKRLTLSEGVKFETTVNTEFRTFDKQGKETSRHHQSKIVTAQMMRGNASEISHRAIVVAGSGGARFYQVVDTTAVPDSINLVPIYAVSTDEMTNAFDESYDDGNGNIVRTVGISPANGSPFTEVDTYVNNTLAQQIYWTWSPVDGGYVLSHQSMYAYSGNSIAATVESTMSGSELLTSRLNILQKSYASIAEAGSKALCLLLPATANALPRCSGSGALLAVATVGLAAHTAIGIETGAGFIGYLADWGGWTASLTSFLKCLDGRAT